MSRVSFEVLFVDDSDDATPGVIAAEAVRRRERIVLLHRPPGARGGGLGGAVVHGLREARAEWVCVMDADLQHPPEVVPRLLDQVRDRQDDLVIASRYCESGTVGSFGRTRATFSRGSTLAARAAFPDRLRG
ncbi:MAG: dolichol-phosphate mannosyltransferase, partial [Thermomicrobiales bacterium]|nr:dolichol-phosphate mannosyltransferase [Thermomicrobiales bacterium]